jgi:hypothetical protein
VGAIKRHAVAVGVHVGAVKRYAVAVEALRKRKERVKTG